MLENFKLFSIETEFHAAKLISQAPDYGWKIVPVKDYAIPSFEVYELFRTGIPIKAGFIQYTGSAGWVLASDNDLFKDFPKFLDQFEFSYFWDD